MVTRSVLSGLGILNLLLIAEPGHGQTFLPLAGKESPPSVSREQAAGLAAKQFAGEAVRRRLETLKRQRQVTESLDQQYALDYQIFITEQSVRGLEAVRADTICAHLRRVGESARKARRDLREEIRKARAAGEVGDPRHLENKLKSLPRPRNSLSGFLPVANAQGAGCYWDPNGADILQQLTLSGTENRGALNIAIVTDFLGPFRTSIDGVLAASGDTDPSNDEEEDQAKAVTRFLSGGGNAVVSSVFPVFQAASGAPGKSELVVSGNFWPRFGLDIPALGTERDKATFSADLGVDARVVVAGEQRKLGVFAQVRPAYVIGTDEFYRGMGRDPRRPFGYVQMSAGLIIAGQVLLAWSFPLAAPAELREFFRNIVSISLSR